MTDVTEINLETGEISYREYNERDLEVNNKVSENIEIENQKMSQRQQLLSKLGISEDEAKLLLGGGK